MKKSKKFVTDHAFVRIMERVHGINIDEMKGKCIPDRVKEACNLGAASIFIGGFTYIIKERKVITVVEGKRCSGRAAA